MAQQHAISCFVIMPFAQPFDAVFEAVAHAASDAVPGESVRCHWLKDQHAPGRITDDIIASLREADVCVADVSGNNPNVMWETGYAMALGKPTILIGQDVERLSFDLRVYRMLPYHRHDLDALQQLVRKSLAQTLAAYRIRTERPVSVPARRHPGRVIAVTGTMNAHQGRVERRIENLLETYLSEDVLWYCGSNGVVDEAVVDYLLSRQQQVVAVGYHRFDLSPKLFQHVDQGKIVMLDASLEAIPKGLSGPTARDVLFAARADLVILLWDGVSAGTANLARYFQENEKNLLLGFV